MGQMKMKDKNIFFKIVKKSILFGGIAAAGTFPVLAQTNYYFTPESSGQTKFSSDTAWSYDEAGSQRAITPPSSWDNVYFVNNSGDTKTLELSSAETTIKELIVAGNSINKARIVFGNAALDNNAVFEVDGKIKGLIGTGLGNYFTMGGSFWTETGQTTNVTVRSKGFELGVEGYGGGYQGTEIIRTVFTVDFDSREEIAHSEFIVDGDVQLGGYGYKNQSETSLVLKVDRAVVNGVVKIQSDGMGWSNIKNSKDGMVFELGGLQLSDETHVDCGIYNNPNTTGLSSTLVFKNAKGTDYKFRGNVSDFGYLSEPPVNTNSKLNIVMDGEGTQRIYTYRADDLAYSTQSGTFTVNNGKFYLGNELLREENRKGNLVLNGGIFGAYNYSETERGFAYFKTATFKSGGISVENTELFAAQVPSLIVVTEKLSKDGAEKIKVDFTNANGAAFNPGDFGITLAEYGADYSEIDNWTEILVAADLEGFSLNEISEGIYDASGDFEGSGIENAMAVFRWVNDSANGYSLQVGLTQVPEPSAVAAVFAAAVLAFVFARKRAK